MTEYELEDLKQRAELARINGGSVSVPLEDLLELIDGYSFYLEYSHTVSDDTDHHNDDDCERCDEIRDDIKDLEEDNRALDLRIEVLEAEIEMKTDAIDRLIKMPCAKCAG